MIAARSGRDRYGTESETDSRRTLRDNIPMRPVAIKITTEVNSDSRTDQVSKSKTSTLETVGQSDDVEGQYQKGNYEDI